MKGIINKTDDGWVVFHTKPRTDHQNGFIVEQIKLHPDDVKQINDWHNIFDNIEGRMYSDPKVDFKIEKDCPFNFTSRCTMDRCDCDQYAKIIQK